MTERARQSFIMRPSSIDPTPKCARFHANMTRPLKHGHRLSVMCNANIAPPVEALGSRQNPPNIGGVVTSIIVDAIHGEAFAKIRCHVRDEIGGRMPPLAYFDPASTIARKGGTPRVVASVHHRVPNWKQAMAGKPMVAPTFCGNLPRQASTRLTLPIAQSGRSHVLFGTAQATAKINSMPIFRDVAERENSPSGELLTTNVSVKSTASHKEVAYIMDSQNATGER
jgi:hypothetical protein